MAFFASLTLIFSAVLALAPAYLPGAVARETWVGVPLFFQNDDAALASVRSLDRAGRSPDGALAQLSPAEHLRRANVYMTNRAFEEARAHWQALVERYPNDPNVAAALYGIGRSYFQVRRYEESLPFFERLTRDYAPTREGRDGLYSLASALLRLGRATEAAARYREYTEKYPQGERIDSAYLNVIDTLREAGQPQEAITWVARTRAKFPRTATDTNALFARLRLDIAGGDWQHAIQTCDELRRASFQSGVMTNLEEVAYLRAYSLERGGRKDEAINAYLAIPDSAGSYHGALATTRLLSITDAARRPLVTARVNRVQAEISSAADDFPAPYRETIVREAGKRKVDPRLVLAIMRQESGFRARAKSPAAARGLLQLTIDTATKYAPRAGLNNLQDDDLYRPETNISIASEYLGELARLFPALPEAVAASYNGGEDNVARWVKRAGGQPDAGVFASEVGFSETKGYVFVVMANYRAYRQLYTRNLQKQF
jgi:soluble lytic murein transglycosylase-like protein